MKKTLILMAAAASVVLTGCTENDLSGDTSLAKETTSAIEFSAKTRSAGMTRTGSAGAIAATTGEGAKTAVQVLAEKSGFGVFAYNTGTSTWSAWTKAAPNFMYNQHVTGTDAASPVWSYTPIKYWPNGIDAANAANSPSNSATQEASNVQNVSFFAYAPYVDVTASSGAVATGTATESEDYETWGITALTANNATTNPAVTYKFHYYDSKYSFLTTKNVDLLWGTRNTASYSETDGEPSTLNGYKDAANNYYNTDLTKQIVDEKVDFYFKHALAKFGGAVGAIKAVVDVDGNGVGSSGFGTLDGKSNVTIHSITIKNAAAAANAFTIGGTFDITTGIWGTPIKNTTAIAKGEAVNLSITHETTGVNTDVMVASNATPTYSSSWTKTGVTTTAANVFTTANENMAFYLIPGVADQTLEITVQYTVKTHDANLATEYATTLQTITNEVTLPALEPNKLYTLVLHLGLTSVKFSAEVADWDGVTGDDVEKEIWLPSNVVATTIATSIATGDEDKAVTATASATSYTITLTGVSTTNTTVNVASDDAEFTVPASVVASEGTATITVTLPTNSTTSAKDAVITLTGKDSSDQDFTRKVTINQLGIQ